MKVFSEVSTWFHENKNYENYVTGTNIIVELIIQLAHLYVLVKRTFVEKILTPEKDLIFIYILFN